MRLNQPPRLVDRLQGLLLGLLAAIVQPRTPPARILLRIVALALGAIAAWSSRFVHSWPAGYS